MNCSICNLPTANVVGSVLPQCMCGWQKPSTPSTKRDWSELTYEEQEEIVSSAYSIRDALYKTALKLKEKNT